MTNIKICGLYREADIQYVNSVKPDFCGFIINFPKSHRNVSPDRVRQLKAQLDPSIKAVGVFVDAPVAEVAALLNDGTVDIAQLHGHEDDSYIATLRAEAPGCTLWKAVKVKSARDLDTAENSKADMVILDNGYGTGQCFDWSLAGSFSRPFILAGGLTPENIPEAISAMHPWCLDISSGVETEKNKDAEKIKAAVLAARKE